jgi:hypothetical protein
VSNEAGGAARTFGEDHDFLCEHTDTLLLSDPAGAAQVAVAPAYQGRVMTSSARGNAGASFGWINRPVIASSEYHPHIHVYGGEDRFWLGPEGGQYAIYFPPGAPFEFEHWQTPACIDTEPFALVSATATEARFRHAAHLTNYTGTRFELGMERSVRLLDAVSASQAFGVPLPDSLSYVAYESENRIINAGGAAWRKETGLLSIWILGMYTPSPETTIVVPFEPGAAETHGAVVNDAYFGAIPPARMRAADSVLYFRGDGRERGKIGLSPQRARKVLGSYDALSSTLTLVGYNQPADTRDYVNAQWAIQEAPYAGDVVNAYNDGPPAPGAAPLGPFYELETSSPARELAPGEGLTHFHRTLHAQGDAAALDTLARATLGVGLADIAQGLAPLAEVQTNGG